jgi:hypothetical protein
MPVKVFYSWQSDIRPNRNFIRTALEEAAAELQEELALDEPDREIVIDQDTQGLPGSPAIAESILTKIRSTDIFVADLTFIDAPNGSGRRRTPNPNVMFEYGYALHALSDARIIGVFNESFGLPDRLPFDLAHRRFASNLPKTVKKQLKSNALYPLLRQRYAALYLNSNNMRNVVYPHFLSPRHSPEMALDAFDLPTISCVCPRICSLLTSGSYFQTGPMCF